MRVQPSIMEIKRLMPKTEQIFTRLYQGWPAARVARSCRCSRGWVYRLAKDKGWPTNPPVARGSRKADQIVVASCLLTMDEMVDAFGIAEPALQKIMDRHYKDLVRTYSNGG